MSNQSPKLKPDFSHRLSTLGDEETPAHVAEAIETLALHAENVLALVGHQFTTNEEESGRMSDEVIYWSINSVIATVKDMAAIVEAYRQAQKTTGQ
jgi:Tat protein secretion system quality control protein TatD with DNase activity